MGLQDRTIDLNSRGTKKKSSKRSSEVLASKTQENKTKVSKLILGNFFPIAFLKIYYFFMFIILQILTSVKEITLAT